MLEAIGNKVIVETELLGEAHTRKSGIMVRERKGGVPICGRIFSIGSEALDQVEFKIGDRVIFNEERPVGFKHDGKNMLALEPDQIMATAPEDVEVLPGGEA